MGTRLDKLERAKGADLSLFFVSIAGTESLTASIAGVESLEREAGESRDEFYRRAFATRAAGKPLDQLTEEEIRVAYRRGDSDLANTKWTSVKIGESKEEEKHEAEQ